MTTSTFIDQLAAGQSAEAKETLANLLSAHAFESLDTRKQELASTLFGGQVEEEVEEVEEGYDSSGAYEKHDPKHPDFVKNYKKYKAANPQGQLGDFVAHMKKQK
jgi:hypothetical protein